MIASTNAITLDGKLVNLDGSGNRVAAMAFGPKKVVLLVGMNKITPDLDTAVERVVEHRSAVQVRVVRHGVESVDRALRRVDPPVVDRVRVVEHQDVDLRELVLEVADDVAVPLAFLAGVAVNHV